LIENLRAQDKKLFDHERGAISAMNIINRVMPILKDWFSKTDKKKVDDFIRIIYQYITSRTPLSGKFVIAKG
jgi:translation initiation factor 2B subunit (eIF-2B alpha/beta/delta family)